MKYLACLINLEGQFAQLLAEGRPDALAVHLVLQVVAEVERSAADVRPLDDGSSAATRRPGSPRRSACPRPHGAGDATAPTAVQTRSGTPPLARARRRTRRRATWRRRDTGNGALARRVRRDGRAVRPCRRGGFVVRSASIVFDPELRFPVPAALELHVDGRRHVRDADERRSTPACSGTAGRGPAQPGRPAGRRSRWSRPGTSGSTSATRRGDPVRAWYRGPLLPHPPTDARRRPSAARPRRRPAARRHPGRS